MAVAPTSVGVSKSGAFLNESDATPVVELISNLPPSSSVSTDHVSVVDASTSDAETAITKVSFSCTLILVSVVVITGASLTSVTVTMSVCVSLKPPASVTFTVTA